MCADESNQKEAAAQNRRCFPDPLAKEKEKRMSRTVRFFKNTCPSCLSDVGIPLLGDFAYGEFIYQTADGLNFAYVSAITEPAWERVKSILRKHCGMKLDKNNTDIRIYQNILIRCADTLNERPFTTDFPLCPKCGSKITSYSDNTILFDKHIEDATWQTFMQLPQDKQVAAVIELLKKERGG